MRVFQLIYSIEANPPVAPHPQPPIEAPPPCAQSLPSRSDSSDTIVVIPAQLPVTPLRANSYFGEIASDNISPNPTSPGGIYENLVCPLCFTLPQRLKRLPCCGNRMCAHCGKEWVSGHGTCPFCRADLEKIIADADVKTSDCQNVQTEHVEQEHHQHTRSYIRSRRKLHLPDDLEAQEQLDEIDVLCPLCLPNAGHWIGECTWVGPRKDVRRHMEEDCPGRIDPNTGHVSSEFKSFAFLGLDDIDSDDDRDSIIAEHTAVSVDEEGTPLALLARGRLQSMSNGDYQVELHDQEPSSYWRSVLCSKVTWTLFTLGILAGFILYMVFGTANSGSNTPATSKIS
ncbi:uncharacterized protein SPPG_04532 [Spizellomyces punctatus DAOM BR117]|uniref:RING-type domain-containing protein n=1 Tax=Spizellomyces punctatus (strain DAOM BR117) TaxID=645134 RepID=A0A0L0HGH4_SPIPD|nr:uncharacterized protein SPPG_04532 [Spizellomyces punctatus DAOM BR117]KND00193.1 hypothetical protein SPPG_04532 [Spizellomyces punctatus DAOM BR117]|eukprot:XP_016608232.1 hypothetical protein SPPG_04532 [Spizellomyces punctatus DAOM BR117]